MLLSPPNRLSYWAARLFFQDNGTVNAQVMTKLHITVLLLGVALLSACAKETPPRTVSEFRDDQLLLEAVLLRCTQNRAESRYEAECVNAREAVKLLEAEAEAKRREELDLLSERKRESLRRTQQAAAEARRRAAAAAQRRKEAEYLAQFGVPLPPEDHSVEALSGNQPGSVISPPGQGTAQSTTGSDYASLPPASSAPTDTASNTGAAPQPSPQTPAATPPPPAPDLNAVREELRRRNEGSDEDGES
jgi:hypothetical protein